MTPADLDAIVARAASVYPEDAGWDGDEAERALTTVTQHVPSLAAALREAWQERDAAIAAGDAVRADYRVAPPTVDEVRVAGRLWGGGSACVLCQFDINGKRGWLDVVAVIADEFEEGGMRWRFSEGDHAKKHATGYLFLGPEGPVSWSEIARLVARGGDRG